MDGVRAAKGFGSRVQTHRLTVDAIFGIRFPPHVRGPVGHERLHNARTVVAYGAWYRWTQTGSVCDRFSESCLLAGFKNLKQ